MNKIVVCNQRDAERIEILDKKHAFISITAPDYDLARLNITDATVDVLRLQFEDVEDVKEWEPIYGFRCQPFKSNMAVEIFDFMDLVKDKVDLLIVHCQAGISRSAAVASFLAQINHIDHTEFMVPPRYPNNLVRRIMRETYYNKTGILVC